MRLQPQQMQQNNQDDVRKYDLLAKEPTDVGTTFQTEQQQLMSTIEKTRMELRNSPEVQQLTYQLNLQNKNDILEFGQKPAEEISKFADRILHSTSRTDLEDSSAMLQKLSKVMQQFDKKEFESTGNSLISKLFNKGKKEIEKLFGKYQTMGREIDAVYTEIESYRKEMMKTNDTLEELHDNLFRYYESLEKYIVAGQIISEELKAKDLPYYEQQAQSGDQQDIMNLQQVQDIIQMVDDRVYNLEMAKMAAFQTAPQIRLMQRTNAKLISKIHSAFIVTIPIFKANLIQAITLKRSAMINDSLNVLEEQTNKMLRDNAVNTVNQSIQIAREANNPMIHVEVLEENMNLIMNGLQEVKNIEDEKERARVEGLKRVHELQGSYQQKLIGNNK